MIEEITQTIGEIVSGMDNSILGTYDPIGDKTDFCATKWARKGKILTDEDAFTYSVVSIIYDESIEGLNLFDPLVKMNGNIFLPAPFYIHGTRYATNAEWLKTDSDLRRKTPIIWLLETTNETRFGKGDSRLFESDLRIFFLDETNVKDFLSDDHRREVVYPMQKLAEEFISVIDGDRSFKRLENYRIKSFSRFGVEDQSGVFQNILDANLSGVELSLTLTKYRKNCKC